MNIVTRDADQVTPIDSCVTEAKPMASDAKVDDQHNSESQKFKDLTRDAKASKSDAKRIVNVRDGVSVTFEVDAIFCFDHGDCVMDMSVDGNFVMTVGSDAKIKLWVVTPCDADEGHLRRIVSGDENKNLR